MERAIIPGLLEKIKTGSPHGESAFIAYDGYVDKIQRAVASQHGANETYFNPLESFGERIVKASNKSAQIELHTDLMKLGGNSPIMAESFGSLGVTVTCFGSLGYPELHPVFQKMHKNVFKVSAGQSAGTNALEFDDGKLILSELGVFDTLNWSEISRRIDIEVLKFRLRKSTIVALVGWCNLPHATDIWNGILQTLEDSGNTQPLRFFFDLADPSKKEVNDVMEVFETMGNCSRRGETTLGLNENETHVINRMLGGKESASLQEKGRFLHKAIPVDKIVIHPVDRSMVILKDSVFEVPGKLVEQPKVSTGGGDNFNAGYCLGQFLKCSEQESLALAMATSGAYVEKGVSADIAAVKDYLQEWMASL